MRAWRHLATNRPFAFMIAAPWFFLWGPVTNPTGCSLLLTTPGNEATIYLRRSFSTAGGSPVETRSPKFESFGLWLSRLVLHFKNLAFYKPNLLHLVMISVFLLQQRVYLRLLRFIFSAYFPGALQLLQFIAISLAFFSCSGSQGCWFSVSAGLISRAHVNAWIYSPSEAFTTAQLALQFPVTALQLLEGCFWSRFPIFLSIVWVFAVPF